MRYWRIGGHEFPDLHYQSECVESWIKECEGSYPKLCDYESEWLNYIVEAITQNLNSFIEEE